MTDGNSLVLRLSGFESREHIEPLAERYGWPVIVGAPMIQKGFMLEFEQGRLQLRDLSEPKMKPLFVDFLSGNMQHRRKFGLHKTQPFPRAIGVTARPGRTVLDATAGLGVDAFFLVLLDCKVTAIERSPVIFELLMDGYRRAQMDDEIGEWVHERFHLVHADAAEYIRGLRDDERPQVIYMDPMFPDTEGKSALPKKGMQLFRKLLGPDLDSQGVFEAARAKALERVVVKRPSEASPVFPHPTHVFEGKTARYDMYAVGPKGG